MRHPPFCDKKNIFLKIATNPIFEIDNKIVLQNENVIDSTYQFGNKNVFENEIVTKVLSILCELRLYSLTLWLKRKTLTIWFY